MGRANSGPAALSVAAAVSVLAVYAIAGSSALSGPVILTIVEGRHGVHVDDLLVVACWAWCMFVCWRLWRGARAD